MACSVDELLETNPCLMGLSKAELLAIMWGAAGVWGGFRPIDPASLLRADNCLMSLSKAELLTVIYSRLCVIAGG